MSTRVDRKPSKYKLSFLMTRSLFSTVRGSLCPREFLAVLEFCLFLIPPNTACMSISSLSLSLLSFVAVFFRGGGAGWDCWIGEGVLWIGGDVEEFPLKIAAMADLGSSTGGGAGSFLTAGCWIGGG